MNKNKMMNRAMALMMSLSIGAGVMGTTVNVAMADSPDVNAIGSEIDVKAILPDNQVDTVSSYISIKSGGKPLKQDVTFSVKNGSDQQVTVNLDILSGVTATSGTIAYTDNPDELKKLNPEYRMDAYLDMPDSVTLAPNELKNVTGKLDVSGVPGTLLGAVGFQVEDETKQDDADGFSITTEMKRVVGVVVNADTTEAFRELKVTGATVERTPAVFNVNLSVTNENPDLYSRSAIEYEVLDHEGQSVFKSEQPFEASFTPQTDALVSLPWQANAIEEGKNYSIKGTITYKGAGDDASEHVTSFEQSFMLAKGAGSPPKVSNGLFNPEVITQGGLFTSVWFYVGVASLLAGITGVVVWRKRQADDEVEVEEIDESKKPKPRRSTR